MALDRKQLVGALIIASLLGISCPSKGQDTSSTYHEPYRLQIHFSPKTHWMNDPNGMVYFKGIYHLFFQYYPNGTTWGPMHWGHAESSDMIHWKEMPIALYPDSLGYIFSGSAVVDSNNTSGFGKDGKIPVIAIFTHHDPKGEKAGTNNFQKESLAYSLDNGTTWTKYTGNPVLKNPGIRDFRDPKVMWYKPEKKWVMTLATQDHITFFSSPNLKDWQKESEFGKTFGAHGGVWECPDLFPLKLNGHIYWILIVNLNPGGPNGGSATQYFVGQFDGNEFTPADDKIKWLDYGPDEYAGVTWNNTGNRRIFLGWMSNWQYANEVPTEKWRNAMTIPRELNLKNTNGELLVISQPVKELKSIEIPIVNDKSAKGVTNHFNNVPAQFKLNVDFSKVSNCVIKLSNDLNEKLIVGYDKKRNGFYIDRTKSGRIDFNPEFGKSVSFAPRLSSMKDLKIELIVDNSSLELFADDGATVMTAIFFPHKPYNKLNINPKELKFNRIRLSGLKSGWQQVKN
jgi:fructan beta-fructosidase